MIKRIRRGDVTGGFTDDHRELDFMIVAAIQMNKLYSFARTDQ